MKAGGQNHLVISTRIDKRVLPVGIEPTTETYTGGEGATRTPFPPLLQSHVPHWGGANALSPNPPHTGDAPSTPQKQLSPPPTAEHKQLEPSQQEQSGWDVREPLLASRRRSAASPEEARGMVVADTVNESASRTTVNAWRQLSSVSCGVMEVNLNEDAQTNVGEKNGPGS